MEAFPGLRIFAVSIWDNLVLLTVLSYIANLRKFTGAKFIPHILVKCLTSARDRVTNGEHLVILINPHTWKEKEVNAQEPLGPWEIGLWTKIPFSCAPCGPLGWIFCRPSDGHLGQLCHLFLKGKTFYSELHKLLLRLGIYTWRGLKLRPHICSCSEKLEQWKHITEM